jgi:hypothetical protein
VDNYLKTVVYPVIYGRQEGLITLGTSVLFECSGRHFMLTAAHLFEKYEGPRFPFEGLVGPTTRQMGIPIGLGHLTALVPGAGGEYLDIIAIELHDQDRIADIKKEWSFLGPSDVASAVQPPDIESPHIVAGFPKEPEKNIDGYVAASFLTVATQPFSEDPKGAKNADPKYDLFLNYSDKGVDVYGDDKERSTIHPAGVSGGGPNFERSKVAREKKKQPIATKPPPAPTLSPMPAKLGRSFSDYRTLIETCRSRAGELDLSRAELDRLAGLPAGYSGKLLGKVENCQKIRNKKRAWPIGLEAMLGTLGLKIVVIEDEAATARTLALREPVDHRQQRFGNVCRISAKLLEKPSQPKSPPQLTVVAKRSAMSGKYG